MRHLTTEQLPSVAWWELLRAPAVRRFALTMTHGAPCSPLDAVIAGVLEAMAPPAFSDDARGRYHRSDLKAVAEETGREIEDLAWERHVRACEEEAQSIGVWAVVLACLEEDQDPPGLEYPLSNRQSGRRRRSKPPAGTAATMRLFIRDPWRRWYR